MPGPEETMITDVFEKMGILALQDLHRKFEDIRALQRQMAADFERKSELELLDLSNRIYTSISILVSQEVKPLAVNRGEWEDYVQEVSSELAKAGVKTLNPEDDAYFSKFLTWVNVVLGVSERFLESWGMKLTPIPVQPDLVGEAWRLIEDEAKKEFLREVQIAKRAHAGGE